MILTNINTVPRKHITSYPVKQNIFMLIYQNHPNYVIRIQLKYWIKTSSRMTKCPNLSQFEYFGGNFEFSSSIHKGATIRLPGGRWLFKKKIFRPWFWPSVKKNILAPSIEKKCLPSIHEKQMSSLYTWQENVCPLCMKMKCLPSMYMILSWIEDRFNICILIMFWSWWRNGCS